MCLDQSTKCTGHSEWNNKKLISYGVLEVDQKEKDYIERMYQMYFKIKDLIERTKPDFIVIEGVQFQNNYKTYSQLSQLQGVVMSLLFEKNLKFLILEPTVWKAFCAIKGRKRTEQKANTVQMVREKFNIEVSEDEADAISIGIWAINNIKIEE